MAGARTITPCVWTARRLASRTRCRPYCRLRMGRLGSRSSGSCPRTRRRRRSVWRSSRRRARAARRGRWRRRCGHYTTGKHGGRNSGSEHSSKNAKKRTAFHGVPPIRSCMEPLEIHPYPRIYLKQGGKARKLKRRQTLQARSE